MPQQRRSGIFKSPHTVPYLVFFGVALTLAIPWALFERSALEFYLLISVAGVIGIWLDTREEPPDEPHNGAERS